MRRIATSTVSEDLFGVGKDGFTSGNQNSQIAPTQLSAEWCNGVQEEICNCIELSQGTLDADDRTQLALSIPYLAGHNVITGSNDYVFEWKSEETPDIPDSALQVKTDTATTTGNLAAVMCFFEPPNGTFGTVQYTMVAASTSGNNRQDRFVVRFTWEKNAGAIAEMAAPHEMDGGAALDWDYFISNVGGQVVLNVKPDTGNPAMTFNLHVTGECHFVKRPI